MEQATKGEPSRESLIPESIQGRMEPWGTPCDGLGGALGVIGDALGEPRGHLEGSLWAPRGAMGPWEGPAEPLGTPGGFFCDAMAGLWGALGGPMATPWKPFGVLWWGQQRNALGEGPARTTGRSKWHARGSQKSRPYVKNQRFGSTGARFRQNCIFRARAAWEA